MQLPGQSPAATLADHTPSRRSPPPAIPKDGGIARATGANGTVSYLSIQFFILIYLQKLAIPVSGSTQISVTMALFFVTIPPAMLRGILTIDPVKLILFLLLVAFAVASQVASAAFSTSSLALLVVLYAAMILAWRLDSDSYQKVCRNFSALMVLPAACVFLQYAYETVRGAGTSLTLEPFVPHAFLLDGYMYESSTSSWVTWNRPNGLFFLEPSYCSVFLACAVIFEVEVLRRYGRAAFFLAAVAATNGGTGSLMLILALPIVAFRRRPSETMTAGIVLLGVAVLARGIATDLPFLSRLGELSNDQSSGYGRLLVPFNALIELVLDPRFFLSGFGAGQITMEAGGSAWPVTKLVYEYGIVTMLAYLALISTVIVGRFNIPLRVALFVAFQMTGGYLLNPFSTILMVLTCCGRIRPGSQDQGLRLSVGAVDPLPLTEDRQAGGTRPAEPATSRSSSGAIEERG